MERTKITVPLCITMLLGWSACTEDKTVATAKDEARDALDEHAHKVVEANREAAATRDANRTDRVQALGEANAELAQDYADAHEGTRPHATAAEGGTPDGTVVQQDGDRFKAYQSETKEEFAARASATIAAIETELVAVRTKKPDADALVDVEEQLAEARKDLDEVVHGTPKVVDDGKLGVMVAINSAQRKLDRIKDDTAAAK